MIEDIKRIQEEAYQYYSLVRIIRKESEKNEDYVYAKVVCGGAHGYYWGDEAEYYTENYKPGIPHLTKILETVCPEITFLKYKKIEDMIECVDTTDYEFL